jgi:large subunit ribosomal protein L21
MSYAVIELGGKQYRVEKGDSVVVDRVDAKEGAKVTARVLFCKDGNKAVMDGPDLDKVKVEAVVAEHLKGDKIRVFKYRPKKRYRRTMGHRSLLTRLEISDIKTGAARPKAEAKPKAETKPKARTEAKPKAAVEAKPKAAKPAAAKKKPAPKKAAPKKPAAKKAAAKKPAAKKPAPKKTEES